MEKNEIQEVDVDVHAIINIGHRLSAVDLSSARSINDAARLMCRNVGGVSKIKQSFKSRKALCQALKDAEATMILGERPLNEKLLTPSSLVTELRTKINKHYPSETSDEDKMAKMIRAEIVELILEKFLLIVFPKKIKSKESKPAEISVH